MPKKVLLIDPPFQKFMNFSKNGIPLGLLSLAGSLKSKGYKVEVLDSDYNPDGIPYPFVAKIEHYDEYLNGLYNMSHPIWQGILNQIEKSSPDVMGISMISTKLQSGLRVAHIAKNLGVKRIIAGGPHMTIRPEDAFGNGSCINSIVRGEGEYVFEEALNKSIVSAERIKNLDSLPWMARETLIGLKNYNPNDLGFIMTSRGCPNSCNFCCSESLWGKKIRTRNISNVVEEMDSIHNKYRTNKFYITDDTFTLNEKRVKEFCDKVSERTYSWSCLTRADRLNERMLEQMINSGCYMIKIGIESGSQRVLDLMNKQINVKQIEDTAKLLNKNAMPWLAYLMIGVPGETEKNVDETMDLVKRINPSYISSAIYTPYPGTRFSNKSRKVDFAREEANHHSMKVLVGDISRKKIIEFMEFSDKYNHDSKKAREIYEC